MAVEVRVRGFDQLQERGELVEDAKKLLEETYQLDERYGRQEKARSNTLHALKDALEETNLRIVVIGEFSRGKSSLLNALLGENILPTANQQTTAINTFIFGTKPGETPHLKIVYQLAAGEQQNRVEVLPWHSDSLRKWGTELDREHKDARKEVERIEAYTDHPLLQNSVTFIDTPGFEGILAHHEDIARQAMDQAHVALWIQSAAQLGGNQHEWNFLRDSLASNFNKFITIVNKWDLVLAPHDAGQQAISQEQREQENLKTVRDNFKIQTRGVLDEKKVDYLTNPDHLMGVSALWANDEDPLRRGLSKISVLAERIEAMCLKGEAEQQILATPLRKLSEIQRLLYEDLCAEIAEIERAQDIETLRDKVRTLEHERKELQFQVKEETLDTQRAHDYWQKELASALGEKILVPLREVYAEVDLQVTEQYVRKYLQDAQASGKPARQIALPAELQQKFEAVLQKVDQDSDEFRTELEKRLNDLRADYLQHIQSVAEKFNDQLEGFSIELPELEVVAAVDLSAFEQHQAQQMDLVAKKAELTVQLQEAQDKVDQADAEREVQQERRAYLKRAQARLEQRTRDLGSAPTPTMKTEIRERERQGFFGRIHQFLTGPIREEVRVPDYSAVNEYRAERRKLEEHLANRTREIEKIIAEAQQQHRRKITHEQAAKRLDRELKRMEREIQRQEELNQHNFEQAISQALQNLRTRTVAKLADYIEQFDEVASDSLEELFNANYEELKQAVDAKYIEPMQTKEQMLRDTQTLVEKGEAERQARLSELNALREDIEHLRGNTESLSDEVQDLYVAG